LKRAALPKCREQAASLQAAQTDADADQASDRPGTSLACLGCAGVAGSQDFGRIQLQSARVTEGVYVLYAAGGNIGVSAGAGGVLLIDSQFSQLHEKVNAAIADVGGGSVRFILNTNGHYDHALGNDLFAKAGAVIVAQENARTRMLTEQVHEVIGAKTSPYPAAALPEVTFADRLALHCALSTN
jgi:cyclase